MNLVLQIKHFLAKHGFSLERIYNIEPDPGLGNGGLGRLASCYMDALTSNDYPIMGFSILYEFEAKDYTIKNGATNLSNELIEEIEKELYALSDSNRWEGDDE